MARRISAESRVLDYFTTSSLEKAEVMLNLVADVVRKRRPKSKSKDKKQDAPPKAS